MCPLVSFEMRTFRIDFFTARELTFVYSTFGIRWTMLLTSRVIPVGDDRRGDRRCSRMCVLSASYGGETVRCNGNQSAMAKGAFYYYTSLE